MDHQNAKTRILVVDDSPDILRVFSLVLRTQGYEVFEADTGARGMDLVRAIHPDLVLLDVVLPDMNGFDICRRLKTDPLYSRTSVMLMSGQALSVNHKVDGLAIGADDYLTKPLALGELLARIRTMVRLQQTNAALRASEEHYRRLVEILPDAVVLVDLGGRIRTVNARALAMLGFGKTDNLIRARALRFVGRDCWRSIIHGVGMLKSPDATWSAECAAVNKDGSRFPIDVNATLLTDAKGIVSGILLVVRDLTQRNQAREALERSQRLFKAILDNISDAAWLQQADGRFLACNEAFARFFRRSPADVADKTIIELSPGSTDVFLREHEDVIRQRKPTVSENNLFDAEGRPLWFEVVRSPVFGGNGEVSSIVGIARDVTERRWAESLLQVQRDLGVFLSSTDDMRTALKQVLDTTMQFEGVLRGGIYLVDPKTGALTLEAHRGLKSAMLRRVAKFSRRSLQSQRVREGLGIDWPEKFQTEPSEALISSPILHGDKTVAVLNLCTRLEMPQRSRMAIATVAEQAGDAIARMRVEQTLQASRQLLEKTLDSIRSAVFVIDAGTDRILECNPGASALFGFTREELIGASSSLLYSDASNWRHFRRYIRTEWKEHGAVNDFELEMRHKNATLFPAELSVVFTVDDAGRLLHSVMLVRDIAARKQFEDKLLILPNQIIEAQESERKRVARELHDGVNQLIAAAKFRLKKVEQDVVSLKPAAREILSRCYDLMVQALEENRRIAHNLRPSDLDDLGLPTACRNFCEQVRSRTRLAFHYDIGGFYRRMQPDVELHLFRILQEAVNNVEKHANAKNVHVRLFMGNGSITLKVKDDGCGMKAAQSRGPGERWSGMGLTNMRERALVIGGTFDVVSNEESGSTIVVTAPWRNR